MKHLSAALAKQWHEVPLAVVVGTKEKLNKTQHIQLGNKASMREMQQKHHNLSMRSVNHWGECEANNNVHLFVLLTSSSEFVMMTVRSYLRINISALFPFPSI